MTKYYAAFIWILSVTLSICFLPAFVQAEDTLTFRFDGPTTQTIRDFELAVIATPRQVLGEVRRPDQRIFQRQYSARDSLPLRVALKVPEDTWALHLITRTGELAASPPSSLLPGSMDGRLSLDPLMLSGRYSDEETSITLKAGEVALRLPMLPSVAAFPETAIHVQAIDPDSFPLAGKKLRFVLSIDQPAFDGRSDSAEWNTQFTDYAATTNDRGEADFRIHRIPRARFDFMDENGQLLQVASGQTGALAEELEAGRTVILAYPPPVPLFRLDKKIPNVSFHRFSDRSQMHIASLTGAPFALVAIYAPGCPPCDAMLKRVAQGRGNTTIGEGVVLPVFFVVDWYEDLGGSTKTDREKWLESQGFAEFPDRILEPDFDSLSVFDNEGVVPVTVIVDANGKVVFKQSGASVED